MRGLIINWNNIHSFKCLDDDEITVMAEELIEDAKQEVNTD